MGTPPRMVDNGVDHRLANIEEDVQTTRASHQTLRDRVADLEERVCDLEEQAFDPAPVTEGGVGDTDENEDGYLFAPSPSNPDIGNEDDTDYVALCLEETDFLEPITEIEQFNKYDDTVLVRSDSRNVLFDVEEMRDLRDSPWRIHHIRGGGMVLQREGET